MKVRITNIQHFSLHDGDGIRTTVFLKGCNLNCPWCANPECISPNIEKGFGYDISLDDLESEILKDSPYYETGGGVTFSGGEPLLQIKQLWPLLERLDINICFETALFVPESLLKIAVKYADEFIVDIKSLNDDVCRNVLGGNLDQYLTNLELLNMDITTFRIPVNKYSLDCEDEIRDLLNDFRPRKLEIFKLHNLAKGKYELLEKEFYAETVSDSQIESFRNDLSSIVPDCEIISI